MRVWIWIWSWSWCWGKVYTTFHCVHREREQQQWPKSGSVWNCCSFYYWFGFTLTRWVWLCIYMCIYVHMFVCLYVYLYVCLSVFWLLLVCCQRIFMPTSWGSRKTFGCNSPFNQSLSHTPSLAIPLLLLSLSLSMCIIKFCFYFNCESRHCQQLLLLWLLLFDLYQICIWQKLSSSNAIKF